MKEITLLKFTHTFTNIFAIIVVAVAIAACGGSNPAPLGVCNTPVQGSIQLLYPIPNSTALPTSLGVAIYSITQFPSSNDINGTGPFPITLTTTGTTVATEPTALPSPLPSPMATPASSSGLQSEVYAVSFGALTAGSTYSAIATVPTYVCGVPNVKDLPRSIGSFTTQ